jgi:nucleotide-binding universal stress UspA family protein
MRILLATDGSSDAREAAAQCGELVSGVRNAIVRIITVFDYIVDFDGSDFVSEEEFVEALAMEKFKRANQILKDTEKIVSFENEHVRIEKEMLSGSPKEMIINEADKWHPDLIIVGSKGIGFWTRALIGSVSDAVVHNAPCNVLVARKRG